jgi:uncharacterized RDD family membrane protein YckC
MGQLKRDRSLGDGVYFAPEDYVGIGPRIVILLIDSLFLIALVWLIAFAWVNFIGEYSWLFAFLLLSAIWAYLVPLKRSKFRTFGYRISGCKLVTLQGKRPSILMLTIRLFLFLLGPFIFATDIVWCGVDDDRQSLRDRYTYMCLVRNAAEPIGTGEIHLAYFDGFGYNLTFPCVVHPKTIA